MLRVDLLARRRGLPNYSCRYPCASAYVDVYASIIAWNADTDRHVVSLTDMNAAQSAVRQSRRVKGSNRGRYAVSKYNEPLPLAGFFKHLVLENPSASILDSVTACQPISLTRRRQ